MKDRCRNLAGRNRGEDRVRFVPSLQARQRVDRASYGKYKVAARNRFGIRKRADQQRSSLLKVPAKVALTQRDRELIFRVVASTDSGGAAKYLDRLGQAAAR